VTGVVRLLWISIMLYPFCLNVFLKLCISVCRLPQMHMVLAEPGSDDEMAFFVLDVYLS
jgi:hypothetical protein